MCKTRELCGEAILGRNLDIVRFRCSLDSLNILESFKVNVLVLLTGVQKVAFFLQ